MYKSKLYTLLQATKAHIAPTNILVFDTLDPLGSSSAINGSQDHMANQQYASLFSQEGIQEEHGYIYPPASIQDAFPAETSGHLEPQYSYAPVQAPSQVPQHLCPPGVSEGQYQGLPNTPPPGLFHLVPEVPQHRRITNKDVALFSDISEFIRTGHDGYGNPISINLTCTICSDRMLEMPPHVSPIGCSADKDFVEKTAVLPCGHIFGFDCLRLWCEHKEEAGAMLSCPHCRYPLEYWGCEHPIPIQPYDVSLERHLQLPPTIPEIGDFVSAFCEACDRAYIEERAQSMAEAIYPQKPPEVFKFPSQCGPDDFTVKRDALVEFLLNVDEKARSQLNLW
ncbi:hypothetical protein F5B20DRAFT_582520 [Whalleya microplaca]|nr:hypothetical protein F5B20DRAFT_582520 [Whalleya microplaca]